MKFTLFNYNNAVMHVLHDYVLLMVIGWEYQTLVVNTPHEYDQSHWRMSAGMLNEEGTKLASAAFIQSILQW